MDKEVKFGFFDSSIGRCVLVWDLGGVLRVCLPLESPSQTRAFVLNLFPLASESKLTKKTKKIAANISLAISGEKVDFSSVQLNMDKCSTFDKEVYGSAKHIPYGTTVTYGSLAKSIGRPRAYRAVGTSLGKNPVPIIIPCHRVLGGDGALRGFSASNGILTKRILLQSEGCKGLSHSLDYDPVESSRFLSGSDPRLAKLIKLIGPPAISPPKKIQVFESLSKAIISQQLSVKAAHSIHESLMKEFGFGNGNLNVKRISKAGNKGLRACGLSRNKAQSIQELAEQVCDNKMPSDEGLKSMSDKEVVEALTKVRGIGRWTAEMILIFQLGRADILAVDDLALRKGHSILLGKRGYESSRDVLEKYARRWKPFRSAASWYLWRLNGSHLRDDYLSLV